MGTFVQTLMTVFKVDASKGERGLRGLGQAAGTAGSAMDRLNSRLDRIGRLFTGGLLAGGIGLFAKSLVGAAAKLETSQIGMATLMQSFDRTRGVATPFASAMGQAADMTARLRKEAAQTPGTLEQVSKAYMAIMGPGRGLGMGKEALAKMAGDIATMDSLGGMDGLLVRDIEQMLRGRIDMDSAILKPFKRELEPLIRKGDQAAIFKVLETAIAVSPAARAAAGESFEGRLSSAKDKLSEIAAIAGKPLMKAVNKGLEEMGSWLDKNRAKVERVAEAIGTGIVDAVSFVGKALAWLVDEPLGNAVLAVGGIVVGFRAIAPVLSFLAAHPFFAVLAGAVAAVKWLIDNAPSERQRREGANETVANVASGRFGWRDAMRLATPLGAADVVEALRDPSGAIAANAAKLGDDTTARALAGAQLAKTTKQAAQGLTPRGALLGAAIQRALEIPRGKTPKFTVDARGSRITVQQKIETDDPGMIAGAALGGAFGALVRRPIDAQGFGLPLATGAG